MNYGISEASITSDINALDITLAFAIRDLDGVELLPAGLLLDEAIINDIARRGRLRQFKTSCLLQHDKVLSDMERFMSEAPYVFVFGGADGVRDHIRQFGEIPIPQPLLTALDMFKQSDFYTYRHSLVVFALTSFMMEKC